METPGLPFLAHSTWMTSFRFADKITHQLWNRNCLRLQIDGQSDSFKADRQSQGQSRTDRHAVSLLKWVTCIRSEPMRKYMVHVFALLFCYLYIFCVSLLPDWRPNLKQRGQWWINAGLKAVKEQKEDVVGIKDSEPYRISPMYSLIHLLPVTGRYQYQNIWLFCKTKKDENSQWDQ